MEVVCPGASSSAATRFSPSASATVVSAHREAVGSSQSDSQVLAVFFCRKACHVPGRTTNTSGIWWATLEQKLQEPKANLGQKWLEEHVQWHDMNTFMMTAFHDMIYNYYVVGPLLSGTLSKRFPSSCVLVMSMIHVQMVHSCLWFMSMIHVQMVHSCLWFMSMIHVYDSCLWFMSMIHVFSRNPPPWSAKTPWFLWSA